jgi:AcrR family transcriptional regulator
MTQGARHNHVIEAAIELFANKGFEGTKTKEIAEAAGINEALIFRDFQSKERLYCAILEYASKQINAQSWIEELAAAASARCDEAVFLGIARQILGTYVREHALFRLMFFCALEQHELAQKFRERQIQPVEQFIQEYVRTRQGEGAFRSADPRALADSFLSLCHHHVLRQVLFRAERDTAAAENITKIFLDGVRSH